MRQQVSVLSWFWLFFDFTLCADNNGILDNFLLLSLLLSSPVVHAWCSINLLFARDKMFLAILWLLLLKSNSFSGLSPVNLQISTNNSTILFCASWDSIGKPPVIQDEFCFAFNRFDILFLCRDWIFILSFSHLSILFGFLL